MTISELRALNKRNGFYFFSPKTMKFFGSRVESSLLKGGYFITSEFTGFERNARAYKVRRANIESGDIDTMSHGIDKNTLFTTKENAKIQVRVLQATL